MITKINNKKVVTIKKTTFLNALYMTYQKKSADYIRTLISGLHIILDIKLGKQNISDIEDMKGLITYEDNL